ncbi:hypothetical protein QO179_24265 [Bacillus stercoris]|nr:hypothetical protein [Bacillus stercoris]
MIESLFQAGYILSVKKNKNEEYEISIYGKEKEFVEVKTDKNSKKKSFDFMKDYEKEMKEMLKEFPNFNFECDLEVKNINLEDILKNALGGTDKFKF